MNAPERLIPLNAWLLRSANRAPFRLYCFSYAGGSAYSFAGWSRELGTQTELCAVQLPGRGSRFCETPFDDLAQLIPALAAVVAAQPAQPFAFFGHSLGALVAFELARYQAEHGLAQPGQLIVSGCDAPRYRSPSEGLHLLSDAALLARLGELNGTPPEILDNRELMELLLPTIRADMKIADTYEYRAAPLLDVPIAVLAGTQDEFDSPDQTVGWREETSGPCDVDWFEGDHFFIQSARGQVLARLRELLAPAAETV